MRSPCIICRKPLRVGAHWGNLVSMTRMEKQPPDTKRRSDYWSLQTAKARFSELVRRARGDRPQHVTVHGREEVVVMSAAEFRRLKGEKTGAALIAALQSSPYRDIDIAPARAAMPVRNVTL